MVKDIGSGTHYHECCQDHLWEVSTKGQRIIASESLTVHAKEDAHLLESLRGQCSCRQSDLVVFQILDNLLDSFDVFGEFGVVCLVPFDDLFCTGLAHRALNGSKKDCLPYVRAYTGSGLSTRGGSPPQIKASARPSGLVVKQG